ncbi:MAG: response regulator [Candidatus Delongbacteria bacterium]|nr:response regulator [Candidatus Delongbacteria bacterium]
MSLRDLLARYGVVKLTLLITVGCVVISFSVYLVTALAFDSFRPIGIWISLLIPVLIAPPIGLKILGTTHSLDLAQQEILKVQAELESRVEERTQDLSQLNDQLRSEVRERITAEQKLLESTLLQQILLENIPIGVIIVDPATRVIEKVNQYAASIVGAPADQIVGKRCHSIICPAEENACPICDLDREIDSSERDLLRFDGSRRPILKTVKRIRILDQEKLLECFIDISDRRQAEEDRRRLEYQLLQTQKLESIGTLSGGIAHDFNNLLMGIQGYTSIMLMSLDSGHPHFEPLKNIEEQVQRAADLTKQLLGFARIGKYEMIPLDLNRVIQQTAALFGRNKNGLRVTEKYLPDLWPVEADRNQIEQILFQLYDNAFQDMPNGGTLHLQTRNLTVDQHHPAPCYDMKPGRYAAFIIADTGHGLPPETLKCIFDPFFTSRRMGRGTGLGLAMVYGVVKGHHGFIDVVSEPGQGTAFTVYFPASEKKIEDKKPAAETAVKGTETILIIDDDPGVLEVSSMMLKSLDYQVYSARNGTEGISIYNQHRDTIDLIILDMIMPGFSGMETFRRLKEIKPDVRVILSSGYSLEGEAQKIMDLGCRGFIQKPFNLSQLSHYIRDVLAQ